MPPGSLEGLRVIDCTHVIAGAYCSMLLADLGADVIKIEPVEGEGNRDQKTTPFRSFDFMNRNKRAIALDLQNPEAAAVVLRLAKTADIFVENFRPGAFERLGLGYEQLRAVNPRLIYCSISGFGHSGPYRERGGFDLVAQGMSGIMSFTGEVGSQRPVAAGVPLSDLNAGSFGALGILAALNHRHSTGQGQKVEATLLESALGYAVWETGLYLTTGEIAAPRGSRHRLAAPYEALKTADGYIVVGVTNQKLWAKFCRAIETPSLETEAQFATPDDRINNRDALQMRIEAVLVQRPSAYWIDRLLSEGVPSGPINTIAQAVEDPHVAARGLLAEVEGRRFTRAPVTMSETPVTIKRGPARVGQHTREVMREAGFLDADVDRLVELGAAAAEPAEG
ncbi:MAG TPA: CoA transferase [Candidatus Saccharimonadales bacterium]|jgi:crotonobetainyl-CoA:carnitine CoA-transferase CaiB-like acyl-CoA transferase|nr:CoA transferase [Candidatus Saccharimonadales bacterium]